MIFGKIDYINLLPFHVYLKRSSLTNSQKKSCEYKKSFPANINKKFRKRAVDAAFISSIESDKKYIKTLPLGIVAKKQVKSVLVKKNSFSANDPHSATSNVLAKVLHVKGEVIIGDKALKLFIENPNDYIDLASEWNCNYNLPFVFARLSVNKHFKLYKKISDNFKKNRIRIPQYILQKYAHERKIPAKEILKYLTLISYKIEGKEMRGLNLFLKKSRLLQKSVN
jgi:chorismate dehydratase